MVSGIGIAEQTPIVGGSAFADKTLVMQFRMAK